MLWNPVRPLVYLDISVIELIKLPLSNFQKVVEDNRTPCYVVPLLRRVQLRVKFL